MKNKLKLRLNIKGTGFLFGKLKNMKLFLLIKGFFVPVVSNINETTESNVNTLSFSKLIKIKKLLLRNKKDFEKKAEEISKEYFIMLENIKELDLAILEINNKLYRK